MLTIRTTHQPARDLGHLLHKHPDKLQTFDVPGGRAHVFYPEANDDACTAALAVEIDPIQLTRRGDGHNVAIQHYVNDRPYTANSQFSVALSHVFGTAMSGRCKERPELVKTPIPLRVEVQSVRSIREPELIERFFSPLGYSVQCETPLLNPDFPDWGDGVHHMVTLEAQHLTLQAVLNHLYVLMPALDNQKHYWIGKDEVEKLVRVSQDWLPDHPEKEIISRRYLRHRAGLLHQARDRIQTILQEREDEEENDEQDPQETEDQPESQPKSKITEASLERPIRLNELRIQAVTSMIGEVNASTVLDLGCGEGHLTQHLMADQTLNKVGAFEVSLRSLAALSRRLNVKGMTPEQSKRLEVIHGSLTYRDARLQGYDAAVAMEVIEHIDPPKLDAFEETVFGYAKPKTVIVTTPNFEYNVLFGNEDIRFRHRDHRFEWTRAQFEEWANGVASRRNYRVAFHGIGEANPQHGCPTQMAVFARSNEENAQ